MTPPPQRRPPPISIPSLLPSRKLFERVPVTNSTLQAYQAMRGNNDRNTIKHGPLYDNLHFFPRDDPLQYRDAKINLPAFPRGLDAGLPPNLLSSWDPPDEDCSHIRQTLGNDTSNPVSQRSQNQATSGRLRRNHYSGSEGFANYGYTSINGKWVDPDSPGELFIALTMSEELSPTDPLHLAKGPHVLSDEEADAFYQEYVTNLVEGEDCEGDPRSLRISPSTFAKWATGATSGDQYAPTYVEAPQPSHRRRIHIGSPRSSKVGRQMQFDIETGSLLSDAYDPSRSPSPLFSAQGVDMTKRPHNLARMAPKVASCLDREAFSTRESRERTQECLTSSVGSSPRIYNSEGAWEELATLGDDGNGEERYNELKERLVGLETEHHAGDQKNHDKFMSAYVMNTTILNLQKDNFFIKRHLEDVQTSAAGNPPPVLPPAKPRMRCSRKGQYQRYFEEREELERIGIAKDISTGQKIDDEIFNMTAMIDRLGNIGNVLHEYLDEDGVVPRQRQDGSIC